MRKEIILNVIGLFILAMVVSGVDPSQAEENIADLKARIEALQKRVDELEASKPSQGWSDPWGFFQSRQNRQWDPFSEINRIQEEMNRMFQNSFDYRGNLGKGMFSSDMSFGYDFDFKETEEGYEIVFDMAGFDQEKVDIQVNESSITVKGERQREDREEGENRMFQLQSYGSFLKTIPLPDDADTSKVKTEKEANRLVIKLPKKVF
ncbi:MAG: Hsp20/alpha crystallin family protein [Candidatus Omnitrophica bacterium]|nr:Hsp20/alpha crystallin family protein [Candidatus Omnitrophota bacterium]